MDNYRRTISSEEQIGEALMRVSNTLEAQRLTKSLEFQEKARRRTKQRFILSIVLLVLLFVLLIVLGLFVFVLFKYLNAFNDKFIPFASSMFDDFGTIWDSLVSTTTYLPVFLEQFTRLNEELITLLQNVNTIDLKGMIDNLNNLLVSTNALLATTNGMLGGLSTMLGGMTDALGPMLKSMASMLTALNSALTPMLASMASGMSQVDWAGMVTSGAGMMTDLISTGDQLAKLGYTMMTNIDPNSMKALGKAISDGAGALSTVSNTLSSKETQDAISGMLTNGASALEGLSGAMANLSKAMSALTSVIGSITNPFG